MNNRLLLGMLLGVVCSALVVVGLRDSGKRHEFEDEAYQHGAGYYEMSVWDNRRIWHWWL